jgi:hypothetical protein
LPRIVRAEDPSALRAHPLAQRRPVDSLLENTIRADPYFDNNRPPSYDD